MPVFAVKDFRSAIRASVYGCLLSSALTVVPFSRLQSKEPVTSSAAEPLLLSSSPPKPAPQAASNGVAAAPAVRARKRRRSCTCVSIRDLRVGAGPVRCAVGGLTRRVDSLTEGVTAEVARQSLAQAKIRGQYRGRV